MSYWCICLIIILNTIIFQSSANTNGDIKIEDYENKNDGMGNSYYRYLLSDGSTREESVRIVNKDTENEYPIIEGKYSYYVQDGQEHNKVRYTVNYVADINGFRPQFGEEMKIIPIAGSALIATLQGGGIG